MRRTRRFGEAGRMSKPSAEIKARWTSGNRVDAPRCGKLDVFDQSCSRFNARDPGGLETSNVRRARTPRVADLVRAATTNGRKANMAKLRGWTIAAAGAMFALASAPAARAGEFDGVTVNIMTQTGAIQEPLQRRAPEFEKMTGAKINIIAVPFSDLYQKVLTDWASGTNSVDAAVFAPQWMVDYVAGGYLEELGPRTAKDKSIPWAQVAPFFRNFSATY